MTEHTSGKATARIATIIKNPGLAAAIAATIKTAVADPDVRGLPGKTIWRVFRQSLDAAIRDIERHPRGKLFQRLIEYGPRRGEEDRVSESNGRTLLSDPECETCVEFIYSHMVNRFKGELAEVLALPPCIALVRELQRLGDLPGDIRLHWGASVGERRRAAHAGHVDSVSWADFTKGADGLITQETAGTQTRSRPALTLLGVVEVKSMACSPARVFGQIDRHIGRLAGGLMLGQATYLEVSMVPADVIRIMVVPSTWRLSRQWQMVEEKEGRRLVLPDPEVPPVDTQVARLGVNRWKITLAWSREALEQAAYEMTFWYMSKVGRAVYERKPLPDAWCGMTPEAAGYNAIKEALYYMLLRPLRRRKDRLATRLYNVYSFGYPAGADSGKMLWPEDFPSC